MFAKHDVGKWGGAKIRDFFTSLRVNRLGAIDFGRVCEDHQYGFILVSYFVCEFGTFSFGI